MAVSSRRERKWADDGSLPLEPDADRRTSCRGLGISLLFFLQRGLHLGTREGLTVWRRGFPYGS